MLKTNQVIERFKLKILNKDLADINRPIITPSLHRAGLELAGLHKVKTIQSVIGWGTKESQWFSTLGKEELNKTIKLIFDNKTPLVLLSKGVSNEMVDIIVNICNEFRIPVHQSTTHLSTIIMNVGWYIINFFAKQTVIHGSLVIINGVGVMIIGKSGIGKSEAVLELIQKGHYFVSDDTVILKRIGTDFIGEPPMITKDFLESRGIGFIDIPKIYGLKSIKNSVKVDLVIELLPSKELNNVDRLGNRNLKYEVLDGEIDKIQIPVENGRTLSALIEAAANVYISKKIGQNPMEIIFERNK